MVRSLLSAVVGLIASFLPIASTFAVEPLTYRVRLPGSGHHAEVELRVPTEGARQIELMMAVWTPGSYLVREYSRHVEGVTASSSSGEPLAVVKSRKNRWRVECGDDREITVRYRVYCREMSVRTNWVEGDFAFLNGAATFLTTPDIPREHRVTLELPATWNTCATALDPHGTKPHSYLAPSFDILVDSPIVAGNPKIETFWVTDREHRLVNLGDVELWDTAKAALDVKQIVEVQQEFWGSLPYPRYDFLNLILESGGGLEHANCCLLLTSRWSFRDPERYRDWLGLVSHELFHAWNVKRLRPVELGPFDYETENHTNCLWIVEGLTSYYDDLLLARGGLLTEKQYLERLGKAIATLQDTPGRLVHALESTSYDAWIKYYRSDENSVNSTVSYYIKGAVVGFLLDARIREATNGERSLDDVMRRAYELYSGERGYTADEFRELCGQVAGVDLSAWFQVAVASTSELDYAPALAHLGLRFKPASPVAGATGTDDSSSTATAEADTGSKKEPEAWVGLDTKSSEGRLLVTRVRRGTPAFDAGVHVDDEILAIDGYRVVDWTALRKQFRAGDHATLLVARRGRLREIAISFARTPTKLWQLEIDPDAPAPAVARRSQWLSRP
ncbi:MAG: M61 family metallopeptidase [Planctomycetota bacterium]